MSTSLFLAYTFAAYLAGAVPWSVWLSRAVAKTDPRTLTDGNPGAANAFRAAGRGVGIAVLVLDFLKAFVPVLVARWGLQLPDEQMFWVALAPMLGHAFSIFLRFRGGRGLTAMFGVWAGITLYEVPLLMGLTAFLGIRLVNNREISSLLIPLVAAVYLGLRGQPGWMIALALAQFLLMVSKILVYYRAKAA